MFASLLGALRSTGLVAAAQLCPREHQLPSGDSRLDREWRLGLYRALQHGDERFYANRCDLTQLFAPNSLKVFSNAEKDSASDSVIMAGVLAAPNDAQMAARYAAAWMRMKCDVIAKVTFPRTYDVAPRAQVGAMEAEVQLYDFLSKLVERKVTPNLVLGLGVFDCTFEQLKQSGDQKSADALIAEARAIYAANEIEILRTDPVRMLLLERGRGFSLQRGIESGQIDQRQLLSLCFQILYTLDVLSRRNIRHGDLHSGNVFVDVLSDPNTEIAYFPFGAATEEEQATYYQVPTFGFVAKLYDWDWGGVYAPRARAQSPPEAWPRPEKLIVNAYACEPSNRRKFGACEANRKADCFTLFSNLYNMPETAKMPVFRRFVQQLIDRRLLDAAPDFEKYDGFAYRSCAGPIVSRCPPDAKSSILVGQKCRGPWEPPDCLMKAPFEMLQSSVFESFRNSATQRKPTTPYVYGNWRTEEHFHDFERWLSEPLSIDTKLQSGAIAPNNRESSTEKKRKAAESSQRSKARRLDSRRSSRK